MTASEKLTQLIENDKLTDEQLDNLKDWGILTASELACYLIGKIKRLEDETDIFYYGETVESLYDVLDYDEDEYIVYDANGVQKLDLDTLNDALDVD